MRAGAGAKELAWGLHGEEVADHLAAALGEHAFRMELHALDGQGAVAQAHDHGPLPRR